MEWLNEDYKISTEKSLLDVNTIHSYLSNESYWARQIPKAIVEKSIQNSLCFGVYCKEHQIGFARVITDNATFAYLADVFILEPFRGRGLSKWLIKTILNYDELKGLRRFLLATHDAHGLYKQFGFKELEYPARFLEIKAANIYTNSLSIK